MGIEKLLGFSLDRFACQSLPCHLRESAVIHVLADAPWEEKYRTS